MIFWGERFFSLSVFFFVRSLSYEIADKGNAGQKQTNLISFEILLSYLRKLIYC